MHPQSGFNFSQLWAVALVFKQAIRSLACVASTLLIMTSRRVSTIFGPQSSFLPLFIRGTAGAFSMSLYYFAIMELPLPDAVNHSFNL